MSEALRKRIFDQLDQLTIVDPHTHINPLSPASSTIADILGYHYYTELAHSAGLAKSQIEPAAGEETLDPKEKVGRLVEGMQPINNTIQYSWFIETAQKLFGFRDDAITTDNWEKLYDAAAEKMSADDWSTQVLEKSKLSGVFLTNDFDDKLEGFDTKVYIPCLRTDDLVFHLAKPEVRERLAAATGLEPTSAAAVKLAIGNLFHHFRSNGARACAISLPPDFSPSPVSERRAETAIVALCKDGVNAYDGHKKAAASFVFWTLAEYCREFQMPFDLMIGVNRGVYGDGVYQGQDLYDSRVSLIQYKELFNAFPEVTFPISVLASVTNQELVSYAWIFPNVVTNGHWWYSNTPTYIEHDAAARLEAVPRTKQIGYYSDMYKLEFALPKFAMYKRILAKILAEKFVIDRGWKEEAAVELGTQVLKHNTTSIFGTESDAYIPEGFEVATAATLAALMPVDEVEAEPVAADPVAADPSHVDAAEEAAFAESIPVEGDEPVATADAESAEADFAPAAEADSFVESEPAEEAKSEPEFNFAFGDDSPEDNPEEKPEDSPAPAEAVAAEPAESDDSAEADFMAALESEPSAESAPAQAEEDEELTLGTPEPAEPASEKPEVAEATPADEALPDFGALAESAEAEPSPAVVEPEPTPEPKTEPAKPAAAAGPPKPTASGKPPVKRKPPEAQKATSKPAAKPAPKPAASPAPKPAASPAPKPAQKKEEGGGGLDFNLDLGDSPKRGRRR